MKNKLLISQLFFTLTMIIWSLSLSSCQKDSTQELAPQVIEQPSTAKYYLSFSVPQLSVNCLNIPDYKICGLEQPPIGETIYFADNTINIAISVKYNGTLVQLMGTINKHSFVVYKDSLNICNGPQRVPFNYTLSH